MAITQLPHYAAAAPRLASVCFANGQQLYQDTASTSSTLNHSHVPCLSSVGFLILAQFGGRRGVRRGGQLGRWRRGDGGDILRTPRPQLQWRSFNCISNSCRPRQISFAVNSILIFIWSGLGRVPGPELPSNYFSNSGACSQPRLCTNSVISYKQSFKLCTIHFPIYLNISPPRGCCCCCLRVVVMIQFFLSTFVWDP